MSECFYKNRRIGLGDHSIFTKSYLLMLYSCTLTYQILLKAKTFCFELVTFHMHSCDWKQLINVSIASSDHVFECSFFIFTILFTLYKSTHPEVFVLRNFAKFTGKNLCQSLFKEYLFYRTPPVAASGFKIIFFLINMLHFYFVYILACFCKFNSSRHVFKSNVL